MAGHMEAEWKRDTGKHKDAREEVIQNVRVFIPELLGSLRMICFYCI